MTEIYVPNTKITLFFYAGFIFLEVGLYLKWGAAAALIGLGVSMMSLTLSDKFS